MHGISKYALDYLIFKNTHNVGNLIIIAKRIFYSNYCDWYFQYTCNFENCLLLFTMWDQYRSSFVKKEPCDVSRNDCFFKYYTRAGNSNLIVVSRCHFVKLNVQLLHFSTSNQKVHLKWNKNHANFNPKFLLICSQNCLLFSAAFQRIMKL